MSSSRSTVDRAALVRKAIVELVAERGIHGTSMRQVGQRAGVATGTAYVHYPSKEELLVAAFAEVKRRLGEVALYGLDGTETPRRLFGVIWRNIYEHTRANPAIGRFLMQIESSPLRTEAHAALEYGDPLTSVAQAVSHSLIDLPLELIYDLGLAPAVRFAVGGEELDDRGLDEVIEACWRAVSRDG